eukprot:1446600-Pyramimonas_sp.AAC.1
MQPPPDETQAYDCPMGDAQLYLPDVQTAGVAAMDVSQDSPAATLVGSTDHPQPLEPPQHPSTIASAVLDDAAPGQEGPQSPKHAAQSSAAMDDTVPDQEATQYPNHAAQPPDDLSHEQHAGPPQSINASPAIDAAPVPELAPALAAAAKAASVAADACMKAASSAKNLIDIERDMGDADMKPASEEAIQDAL